MNLLIHQGALGDWVLTFPILRALSGETLAAAAWSKARLAARMIPHIRPLNADQRDFTLLHAANGYEQVTGSLRDTLGVIDDLIVSFVSTGDNAWADNVRRLAPRARLVCIDPNPAEKWTRHATEWHAAQMRKQRVELSRVEAKSVSNPNGPIVIHPGSGGQAKCWPRERVEALMEQLQESNATVLPLLGEVELETWPKVDVSRWEQHYGARVVQTLDDLHAILSTARLYIGNDSGPTHLAAQMGLPTVALFGPTSPKIWKPVGPQVRVLAPAKMAGMEWLSVETVLRAVT